MENSLILSDSIHVVYHWLIDGFLQTLSFKVSFWALFTGTVGPSLFWRAHSCVWIQLRTLARSFLASDFSLPPANLSSARSLLVSEEVVTRSRFAFRLSRCLCLCSFLYATRSQSQSKSSLSLSAASHLGCTHEWPLSWSKSRTWYGIPSLSTWALEQPDTTSMCLTNNKKQRTDFLGPFSWSCSTYWTLRMLDSTCTSAVPAFSSSFQPMTLPTECCHRLVRDILYRTERIGSLDPASKGCSGMSYSASQAPCFESSKKDPLDCE